MTVERLYHSLMLALQRDGFRRGNYLRKHDIFHHVGRNVLLQSRKMPLYPKLISIHDNVVIASRVSFVTHDIVSCMLNNADPKISEKKYKESVGCIEIMDNVFVGAGTTILYGVRIGSNVIVAAGSVIVKDIPSNSVVGGVPAKVIEPLDAYLDKLNKRKTYPDSLSPRKEIVSKELEEYMWNEFQKERA